jgi:hypothetical protein
MTVLAVIFAFFAIVNAGYSQFFPPLYFQSMNNEKETAITYLKSIQHLPEFQSELRNYVNLYGTSVTEAVYYEDALRARYIQSLEKLREQNPTSRDINYYLSQLYRLQGDTIKGDDYLDRARAIDPALP